MIWHMRITNQGPSDGEEASIRRLADDATVPLGCIFDDCGLVGFYVEADNLWAAILEAHLLYRIETGKDQID